MRSVGSQDEAIVVLSSHPLWEDYRTALIRLDEARAKLDAAPEEDTTLRDGAARHVREALQDCDAVQQQIMTLRRRTWI